MIHTSLATFPQDLAAWVDEHRSRINANTHFRSGGQRNHDYEWELYVRRTRHAIRGEVLHTLDFATVGVRPDLRRQGIAKSLIHVCEQEAIRSSLVVYVENIVNPNLESYLGSRNYQDVSIDPNFGPTLVWDPSACSLEMREALATSAPTIER